MKLGDDERSAFCSCFARAIRSLSSVEPRPVARTHPSEGAEKTTSFPPNMGGSELSALGNTGIDTARWSTTNGVYGLGQPKLTTLRPVTCRPQGTDIGLGRPWGKPNSQLLSPRVPLSWELGSTALASPSDRTFRGGRTFHSLSGGAGMMMGDTSRPQSRASVEDHVTKHVRLEARYMAPSSQRDAASAYSMMLARSLAGDQRPPHRPGTSNLGYERTWWNMSRNANTGPRRNGA